MIWMQISLAQNTFPGTLILAAHLVKCVHSLSAITFDRHTKLHDVLLELLQQPSREAIKPCFCLNEK